MQAAIQAIFPVIHNTEEDKDAININLNAHCHF